VLQLLAELVAGKGPLLHGKQGQAVAVALGESGNARGAVSLGGEDGKEDRPVAAGEQGSVGVAQTALEQFGQAGPEVVSSITSPWLGHRARTHEFSMTDKDLCAAGQDKGGELLPRRTCGGGKECQRRRPCQPVCFTRQDQTPPALCCPWASSLMPGLARRGCTPTAGPTIAGGRWPGKASLLDALEVTLQVPPAEAQGGRPSVRSAVGIPPRLCLGNIIPQMMLPFRAVTTSDAASRRPA
jgi:hypothetical protein